MLGFKKKKGSVDKIWNIYTDIILLLVSTIFLFKFFLQVSKNIGWEAPMAMIFLICPCGLGTWQTLWVCVDKTGRSVGISDENPRLEVDKHGKRCQTLWFEEWACRQDMLSHSLPSRRCCPSLGLCDNGTLLLPSTALWNSIHSGILGRSHKCDLGMLSVLPVRLLVDKIRLHE